ncbi:uncharacterized protein LOC129764423 isoform X2 [Toxorhynchites rutilus septentrionalis]|uniref:uncharacterized protein LOC129764423 isoform X2 n=1 Tax=Toxorhynchites rutilus septentrionalis TaxID=329112 RepID=UPI00247AC58B|nr:uncharacterized protein LOC129764423 isoform X2 [Toxorhynchites rutilus septentrionalis]
MGLENTANPLSSFSQDTKKGHTMVIGADHERNGIADFFTQTDPEVRKITLAIGNIISKNTIKEITLEKSLNVMLDHCHDATTLLSKNIVKSEFIYRYLQNYNIQMPPESTKSSLIKQCLNFWRAKYGAPLEGPSFFDGQANIHPSTSAESSSSNSTMQNTTVGNMKNLVATGGPIGNNTNGPGYETTEPGLEQYPVNLLALDYTTWFYLKWNRNSLDESAFWPDAVCSVMLEISETQQGVEEYSFQFVPNVMFDGCQGRLTDSGVLVVTVGVVYNNRKGLDNRLMSLGVFESMVRLRRDPHENNNWKITMFKLYIRYKPVDNLPALSSSKMLTECLLIPLTLDSV